MKKRNSDWSDLKTKMWMVHLLPVFVWASTLLFCPLLFNGEDTNFLVFLFLFFQIYVYTYTYIFSPLEFLIDNLILPNVTILHFKKGTLLISGHLPSC